MEFLENLDSTYYFIFFGVVFIVGYFIIKRQNNFKLMLQFRLIFYGFVMAFMLFWLPSTPSLASFGYPADFDDIENKQKLLKYLQDYNEAIVKTTEVVYWMIFITVFWFVSIISSIIKHFKIDKSAE
ncbi:hypothetical protein [Flavobacterium sp.]|jgi:hypothetical protein|uniref:hypothetical protein n=1 Tax=Flavobacterium sp. TaxID=239 RepID=UPI0037C161C6